MTVQPDTTAAAESAVGMSAANAPKNSGLRALAEKATPGDLDTVPNPPGEYGGHSTGWYECPACSGQGEVEGATYCNFDGVALGVQFFGIGNEHQNYEAFFRAANPVTVLALLDENERMRAALERVLKFAFHDSDCSSAPDARTCNCGYRDAVTKALAQPAPQEDFSPSSQGEDTHRTTADGCSSNEGAGA